MGLRDFFKKKRKEKFGGSQSAETTLTDAEISANWVSCKSCNATIHKNDYQDNLKVCNKCNYHGRLLVDERIALLVDEGSFNEIDIDLSPEDPLSFSDDKPYAFRLDVAQKKAGTKEAVKCGVAKLNGTDFVISVMDFSFIGGSMGSVVGEKITRAIEKAIELKVPFIMVSASGGARMHEGLLSLMQMAKTSVALEQLSEARLPFLSILTDPTFGGVAASFATLGDLLIAEPQARIGFAGKRVIEETIREKLPKDFQTAEYLLEHGQLDMIIERKVMKSKISKIFEIHGFSDGRSPFLKKFEKNIEKKAKSVEKTKKVKAVAK